MSLFATSITLIIASQVAYQLAQKTVPPSTHPMVVLTIVYVISAAICPLIAAVMDRPVGVKDFRDALGWPTYVLALSVVGIEAGYLLAYRNGWALSTTYPFASAGTIVLLILIGVTFFREPVTARHLIGVALALAGGWLITSKA